MIRKPGKKLLWKVQAGDLNQMKDGILGWG